MSETDSAGPGSDSGEGMPPPPLITIDDHAKFRATDLAFAAALSDMPSTTFEAAEIITQQDGTLVWRIRGTTRT